MRRFFAIVIWLLTAQLAAATGIPTAGGGSFVAAAQNVLEQRLFADADDGRLDEFSPLQAALVAGGVEDADSLRHYEQKAAMLVNELRHSASSIDSPRGQVEVIFEFLHHRVLRGGYDLTSTDLRRALDAGRFNCVSATVLFNYFAGELGLDCRGLEMPGHAMSRVVLPKRPREGSTGTDSVCLDVETTCPRWFHLAGNPKRQAAAAKQTIGGATSTDRSKAREVSPLQVAAMIYYNRGVDFLAEKRFSEAASANAKALRLDPGNATARGNLLATINNWSIALGDTERFADAVDLLRQGRAIDANFKAFGQNYVHVHHKWVEHLCHEGRFGEALEILSRAAAEMPDRDYLRRAQTEVHERWEKAIAASPRPGPMLQMPCIGYVSPID